MVTMLTGHQGRPDAILMLFALCDIKFAYKK